MTTTIQKWGNSQGIRIPKFILEAVHWNANENLVVKTDHNKRIIEKAEKSTPSGVLFLHIRSTTWRQAPLPIKWDGCGGTGKSQVRPSAGHWAGSAENRSSAGRAVQRLYPDKRC